MTRITNTGAARPLLRKEAGRRLPALLSFQEPSPIGRLQPLGTNWYWSIGVGTTVEVHFEDVLSEGSPWGSAGNAR